MKRILPKVNLDIPVEQLLPEKVLFAALQDRRSEAIIRETKLSPVMVSYLRNDPNRKMTIRTRYLLTKFFNNHP